MLIKMQVDDFVEELASDSPAPGGGSISALSGAMGAGLVSMVARLTIGKKGYEEVEPLMKETLEAAEKIRTRLTLLVDEDTNAFNDVMAAFGMPRQNTEEKSERTAAIQAGFQKASMIPLEVASCCLGVLTLARSIAGKANKNTVSDLGVAAQVAYAGVEGAVMNVKINLPSIKDAAWAGEKLEKTQGILDQAGEFHCQISEMITELIG